MSRVILVAGASKGIGLAASIRLASQDLSPHLSMAIELAPDRITANAVAPGPVETELFRKNAPPGSEGEKRFLALMPRDAMVQPAGIAAITRSGVIGNACILAPQAL